MIGHFANMVTNSFDASENWPGISGYFFPILHEFGLTYCKCLLDISRGNDAVKNYNKPPINFHKKSEDEFFPIFEKA